MMAAVASALAVGGGVGCAPTSGSGAASPQSVIVEIPAERMRIMELAARPNPAGIPALVAGLESSDAETRLLAVRGLTALAPPDALPKLFHTKMHDPDSRVVQAATRALLVYPEDAVDAVAQQLDPAHVARTHELADIKANREGAIGRRRALLQPPVDEEQMEEWASDTSGDVGFFVENIVLVKDHAPPGHPYGFNGRANAGELLEYRLTLKNSSLGDRRSSSAYCYTFNRYCTVINRKLRLPAMGPGEVVDALDTLLVLVAPDTPPDFYLNLYLEVGDSHLDRGSRPVYRAIPPLHITNRGLGPVRFEFSTIDDDRWGESDGNNNGIADWGERVEIRVTVRNDGPDSLREASLTMTTLTTLASVGRYTPVAGDIPPGGRTEFADGRPGFSRAFSVALATGYAGEFDIPLQLTLTVPVNPFPDETTSDTGRLYIQPRQRDTERPQAVATFTQRVILRVGTNQPQSVGVPFTYRAFDPDQLISLFVLNDNHAAQQTFLENNETRWIDYREVALLDQYTR